MALNIFNQIEFNCVTTQESCYCCCFDVVVFIVAVVLGFLFVAVVIMVGPKLDLKFS